MREILFRGKRRDNGEWTYGSLLKPIFGAKPAILQDASVDDSCRLDFEYHFVDPAAVGQFTGLTDRNGKRIFEGDIIKTRYANVPKADFIEEVVFHNGRFCALYKKLGCEMWQRLADGVPHHPGDRSAYMEWCEVIGNIHDNPELLEASV